MSRNCVIIGYDWSCQRLLLSKPCNVVLLNIKKTPWYSQELHINCIFFYLRKSVGSWSKWKMCFFIEYKHSTFSQTGFDINSKAVYIGFIVEVWASWLDLTNTRQTSMWEYRAEVGLPKCRQRPAECWRPAQSWRRAGAVTVPGGACF